MPTFRFTTLDVPGAQGGTVIQGINDRGQLVGEYTVANFSGPGPVTGDPYPQAFVDTGGTITTIGPGGLPYGQNSFATGINNRGQIVGHSGHYETTARGFLYQNGQFTQIDAPGNTAFTTAYGINDFGQVVGAYLPFASPGGRESGFVWTSNGTFQTIAYPGAAGTEAHGINNRGWIVGDYVPSGGGNNHGFLDVNGHFQTIDVPGAVSTVAEGVNNVGEIVGTFYDGSHSHGFVDLGGRFDIIDVPGATDTFVHGVNDFGQLVGAFQTSASAPFNGFVATPSGGGLGVLAHVVSQAQALASDLVPRIAGSNAIPPVSAPGNLGSLFDPTPPNATAAPFPFGT